MLVELSRSAERRDLQAPPAFPDGDTVALEWSLRQEFRAVGARQPARRSVRDGPGNANGRTGENWGQDSFLCPQ